MKSSIKLFVSCLLLSLGLTGVVFVHAVPTYDCAVDQSIIPTTECEALQDIYIAMDGDQWSTDYTVGRPGISSGWLLSDNPCNWNGISCSNNSVTTLDFDGKYSGFICSPSNQAAGLSGSFLSSISNLTSLENLHLARNYIDYQSLSLLTQPLKQLCINSTSVTDLNFMQNYDVSNLTHLVISSNSLLTDVSGIAGKSFESLITLVADNSSYNDFGSWSFSGVSYLSIRDIGYFGAVPSYWDIGGYGRLDIKGSNDICGEKPQWLDDAWNNYYSGNLSTTDIEELSWFGGAYQVSSCPDTAWCNDNADCSNNNCIDNVCGGLVYDCAVDQSVIPTTECEALVSLYNSTDGTNWNNNTNRLVSNDPSNWRGVTVVGGHVIHLDLTDGVPNNYYLNGTGNNLSGIIPSLQHLTMLESLNLSKNSLSQITTDALDGLTVLHSLYIAENSLSAIPAGLLDDLIYLGNLYLQENLISNLPSGIFDNNTFLSYLSLRDNQLTSLPNNIFDSLSNVQSISLAHNLLTSIPSNVFDSLSILNSLYLQDNQLTSLPSNIFDDLTNLTILYISENQLTSLPNNIFDSLTNLLYLYLWGNQLTSLPNSVFDNLTSLRHLYLYENLLTSLPNNIFDTLIALEVLHFGDNQITTLPNNVFDSLSVLTHLTFEYNQITALPNNIFDSLSVLAYLAFHENGYASALTNTFGGMYFGGPNATLYLNSNNQICGEKPLWIQTAWDSHFSGNTNYTDLDEMSWFVSGVDTIPLCANDARCNDNADCSSNNCVNNICTATGSVDGLCGATFNTCAAGSLTGSNDTTCGVDDTRSCMGTYNGATDTCTVADLCPGTIVCYSDNDNDTYGDIAQTVTGNTCPAGTVTSGGDCDDQDNTINPSAIDVCGDGIDQDCQNGDQICGQPGGGGVAGGQYVPSRFADLPHHIGRVDISPDERVINRDIVQKSLRYNNQAMTITTVNPRYKSRRRHTSRTPYMANHSAPPTEADHEAINILLDKFGSSLQLSIEHCSDGVPEDCLLASTHLFGEKTISLEPLSNNLLLVKRIQQYIQSTSSELEWIQGLDNLRSKLITINKKTAAHYQINIDDLVTILHTILDYTTTID